jgi:hypothetical protein
MGVFGFVLFEKEPLPMATPTTTGNRGAAAVRTDNGNGVSHRSAERRTTETKASFKTTEFIAYLAVLAGILVAGLIVDNGGDSGFGAQKVWLYATILTVGYMIARGLAKSGSRDPYTHTHDDRS